jgi:hypothetical protein
VDIPIKTKLVSLMTLTKTISWGCTMVVVLLLTTAHGAPAAAQSEDGLSVTFATPPHSAQPMTWWHWMNGNVTREGITADLESMARVGIVGAQIFNVANTSAVNIPAGPAPYLSARWLDLVDHAAREAERLGLTLGMNNAAGWSGSGGRSTR